MGWTFTIPQGDDDALMMSSADLTAGEDTTIYSIVASLVPHDESSIGPAHCPICRNAIAIVALMSRGDVPDAIARATVRDTPRAELAGYFTQVE